MGNIIRLRPELSSEFIRKLLIREVDQRIGRGDATRYRKRIINIAVEFSNGYKTSIYIPKRNKKPEETEETEEEKEIRILKEQERADLELKHDVDSPMIKFHSEENPFKGTDVYYQYLEDEENGIFDPNPYIPNSYNIVSTLILNAPEGFDEFKIGGQLSNNTGNFKFKLFDSIQRIGLFKNGENVAEYLGELPNGDPVAYTSNFPKSINNSLVNGFLVSAITFQIMKVYYNDPQFDGGWGDWTVSKECTISHDGLYMKEQTRQCNKPLPQYSGQECELDVFLGDETFSKAPNTYNFRELNCPPVDGKWSEWDNSAKCTQQADGMYKQTKTRLCNNPEPKYGGADCSGPSTELIPCNPPVDGGWSDWITDAQCTQRADGTYKQTKTRLCNNPAPINGGVNCSGVDIELIPCNPSPIDGKWSKWITNKECKKQGNGTYKQTKTRLCNNPEPKYGGKKCVGDEMILITCKPVDNDFNFEKIAENKMLMFRFLLLIIIILVIVNRIKANPQISKNVVPTT